MSKGERVTASEAVYGFSAWLTTREKAITIGALHESTTLIELAKKWIDENNLPEVTLNYPDNIKHPQD